MSEDPLREVHARLRKDLADAEAARPQWSTEEAAQWGEKIRSARGHLAKASKLEASGSAQQRAEHLELLNQTLALVQQNASRSLQSLEDGGFAIALALEELGRRWGTPNQPEVTR